MTSRRWNALAVSQRHYFTGDLGKVRLGQNHEPSAGRHPAQRALSRRPQCALQEFLTLLPAVFHEIFKDAMVPYGDHRTLALFLNTMNRHGVRR